MNEILDLVAEYVAVNKLSIPIFASGRPGKDWFHAFMKRNKLSLKKANMISAARKSATGNPFIIHDFYDQLEKVITDKNLEAKHIWSCDESGFPNDPAKCKMVSVKRMKLLNAGLV